MATYICPECKSSDKLEVAVVKWALVKQVGDDIETLSDEAHEQSEDWDNTSQMKCLNCGHYDTAIKFYSKSEKAKYQGVVGLVRSICGE